MRDVFESDRRIFEPDQCVGLTVAEVRSRDDLMLIVFTDGRFLVAGARNKWDDPEIDFDITLSLVEAAVFDLVSQDAVRAHRAAEEAELKAAAERNERELYERLRAKFGDGTVPKR